MYDELIKRLRHPWENNELISELTNSAADAIENTSKAYQMMAEAYEAEVTKRRWISVTEQLPEEKHAVIVWEPKYLNHYICVLSEGDWYVFGGYGVKVFGVTHWMPLPEPPKEE